MTSNAGADAARKSDAGLADVSIDGRDVSQVAPPSQELQALLKAALEYAARGIPVFPCFLDYGNPANPKNKSPLVRGGFHAATTDEATIRRWWKTWPGALIGVPTGLPETFNVIDIDNKEGKPNGFLAIPEWRSLSSVIDKTMSNGAQLFFESDPEIICVSSKLAPGIDTRGLGGYVIVPPSPGYEWLKGNLLDGLLIGLPKWPAQYRPDSILRGAEQKKSGPPEQSIELIRAAVAVIPNPNLGWDEWNTRGMAIFAASGGSDEGLAVFDEFSQKSDKYDPATVTDRWEHWESSSPPSKIGFGSLSRWADEACGDTSWRDAVRPDAAEEFEEVVIDETKRPIQLTDFVAYMPAHSYLFKPTREMWPASSVNARLPLVGKTLPSAWLDRNRPVEQMTWAPGEPIEIKGRLVADGGWIERPGVTVFNLYRPPAIIASPGDPAPWLNHIRRVYPDDANHIIAWLAHRVQRPHEKINHALVLGGAQGTGKDTLLEPVKQTVGPWNFTEVSPRHMLGRFNGFLRSVILRVSEARDLGDIDRFAFYDHMKTYTAAPPDVLRVDEKNLREYAILNCCGVIITTNHKADGIFLPADDRRHFVAWCDRTKDDFAPAYWDSLWRWYGQGGDRIVAAHLSAFDLSEFNAKAPPPKTPAFWAIVDAGRAPEDADLADVLDRLGNPAAVTMEHVQDAAKADFGAWLRDRKNRRMIPHRFEQCEYEPVRNEGAGDGLWKVNGKRQVIYARKALCLRDRIKAAMELR